MKLNKLIFCILFFFFKTGNVLSDNDIFHVNNIEIDKDSKVSNKEFSNKAIEKAFYKLIDKILLEQDVKKLSNINIPEIKELVIYHQVAKKIENNNKEKLIFKVSFDKNKIHNLFSKKGISYSEINNKEIFLLPILKQGDKIYIYNQNFFYDNWKELHPSDLVEFILPIEKIEIIQLINSNYSNLMNIDLEEIFEEYSLKNIALILIEDMSSNEEKIYLKARIAGKNIVKKITIKRENELEKIFYKRIVFNVKKQLINIIKSQNLIDVSTPSFLNAKFDINKKNNLLTLNQRLRKIDLIEEIFVQEFNNSSVFIKIKYLGKLDQMIERLKDQKIILNLISDQWSIKLS